MKTLKLNDEILKSKRLLFVATLLITITTINTGPVYAASTVFFSDFDGALPAEISGAGTLDPVQAFTTVPAGANSSFTGSFLRNSSLDGTTTLSLSGLPAHTGVDVGFLLGVLDSWDGQTGGAAPDYFNVSIDGTIIQASFDGFEPGDQLFPAGATQLLYDQQLGFGIYNDAAYDFSLSIPHTASSLTVSFVSSGAGFQGGDDESWAIDNLKVSLEGVITEPGTVPDSGGTLLLLASTVGSLPFLRRRA
jgi:hypothetical protein